MSQSVPWVQGALRLPQTSQLSHRPSSAVKKRQTAMPGHSARFPGSVQGSLSGSGTSTPGSRGVPREPPDVALAAVVPALVVPSDPLPLAGELVDPVGGDSDAPSLSSVVLAPAPPEVDVVGLDGFALGSLEALGRPELKSGSLGDCVQPRAASANEAYATQNLIVDTGRV